MRVALGKVEVWRSLGTDSLTVARRRLSHAAAAVEDQFSEAAARAGLVIDTPWTVGRIDRLNRAAEETITPSDAGELGPSLRHVYDAYMADPTHDWSPRTRMAYETTRRMTLSILGPDLPIRAVTRARCRQFIEVLRWTPRNASKLYPQISSLRISELAKRDGRSDLISPSNINTYLNKFGGVLNWALREELIDRNPALGLRVADTTLRRDKRLPFSTRQLRAIFSAPLYTGCRDDGHGYATLGPNRPKNARFWIPLIALFNGLRLNEACQLDVADVRIVGGITCFVVTASAHGPTDKRLKTASSERLVPVHPELLTLGFVAFVEERARAGKAKLFGEVTLGSTGYRSATFSAWFARFAAKESASTDKTCFHSFRHSFRDALREAGIDRDVALALGGWSRAGGAGGSASIGDAYGSGYRAATLFDAVRKVSYPDLDLSHLREPYRSSTDVDAEGRGDCRH